MTTFTDETAAFYAADYARSERYSMAEARETLADMMFGPDWREESIDPEDRDTVSETDVEGGEPDPEDDAEDALFERWVESLTFLRSII